MVIDTIFSDHINDQVLQGQVLGMKAAGETSPSPATPSPATYTSPLHSSRRGADEGEAAGEESLTSQPTIVLLHSLPAGDLILDLKQPPSKAIGAYTHEKSKKE